MRRLILAASLSFAFPAYAEGIDGDWHLIGIEGQPAPAPLSISFATDGTFSGQAPCNRFFGTVTGTLPALSLGSIGATRMACPEMATEAAYFESLDAMQSAELAEDRLFLIGPEGRVLEFARKTGEDMPCLSCAGGN
ncbi:MAG: META domain-containing protein [Rhodobacter sp.]|jgi:heat shock protein HslJ|nr:META domain-containing protein [Rhodobacter sp.]MBK8437999.1 META domain-containing protein [Rhodobacter sp.]